MIQSLQLLAFLSIALLMLVPSLRAQDEGAMLGNSANFWQPADGLYLVLQQSVDMGALRDADREEIILVNDYHFLENKPDDPPIFMILPRNPDVPLLLREPPVAGRDDNDKPMLNLALADEQAEALRHFTEKHLNETAAIVIGGRVVSAHTIKAVITGGSMQITRCDENSCDFLSIELMKNVQDEE
jgi:hypothetical protein